MKIKKGFINLILSVALMTVLSGCSGIKVVQSEDGLQITSGFEGGLNIGDPAAFAEFTEDEKEDFEYWTEDSKVISSITEYVEEVTDETSDKFIPVEDRVAVFDMDGTLVGELYPSYFEYLMFIHRALYDESYEAPEDMKDFAQALEEGIMTGSMPGNNERLHAEYTGKAYAGMTVNEFKDYVREFMKTKADGFTNLTKGEAYYWPMLEVFEYLKDNDFNCYIVSGSDRILCRTILEDNFPVEEDHFIGMSYSMVAKNQGDTDGLEYVYSKDDELVRGDQLLIKTIKMNKVSVIAEEIGKVPVLSFGNSSGDVSMAQYVLNNEEYESRAYMLLCDDLVREHGNMKKADSMRETCVERGFEPVSMRDDFATIYGDDVEAVPYDFEEEALSPAA